MRQNSHAYDREDGYNDREIPRASDSFRVPRERPGIDRTTRNMILVAGGIALLMVLGVGIQAMLRPHGLPVVTAQFGPWRVKPAHRGGLHVLGASNDIFNGARPVGQDQALPGPETPNLAALARDEQRVAASAKPPAPQAQTAQASPGAAIPGSATPAATTPGSAVPAQATTAAATTQAAAAATTGATMGAVARIAAALPIPPLPTVPPPLPAPAPRVAAASFPRSMVAAAMLPPPATEPATQPASRPAIQPATGAPATTPITTPATAALAAGQVVQLAALPTEAGARAEWQILLQRMPSLLGGRAPIVARATVNGQTWWRLRTGGFASRAQALDFCARVRAQGGACAAE